MQFAIIFNGFELPEPKICGDRLFQSVIVQGKKSERVLKTVSMGEDKGEVVWMCGLVGCKGNGARVCVRSRIHFFLDRCKIILI